MRGLMPKKRTPKKSAAIIETAPGDPFVLNGPDTHAFLQLLLDIEARTQARMVLSGLNAEELAALEEPQAEPNQRQRTNRKR
jgi:hypothetical protein